MTQSEELQDLLVMHVPLTDLKTICSLVSMNTSSNFFLPSISAQHEEIFWFGLVGKVRVNDVCIEIEIQPFLFFYLLQRLLAPAGLS